VLLEPIVAGGHGVVEGSAQIRVGAAAVTIETGDLLEGCREGDAFFNQKAERRSIGNVDSDSGSHRHCDLTVARLAQLQRVERGIVKGSREGNNTSWARLDVEEALFRIQVKGSRLTVTGEGETDISVMDVGSPGWLHVFQLNGNGGFGAPCLSSSAELAATGEELLRVGAANAASWAFLC